MGKAQEKRIDRLRGSIYETCSTPRLQHDELTTSATKVDVDPSFFEPEALLAGALATTLREWDKTQGREVRDKGQKKKRRGRRPRPTPFEADNNYVLLAREVLREEREDRELPEDYPATDLLVGVHAHAANYYDSLGMLRQARADPAPKLPNMRKSFQASALVAMSVLVEELVRDQLASAAPAQPSLDTKAED